MRHHATSPKSLRGNPYFLLVARRPFREARLRAHILREHRAGRDLDDILGDPYLRRHASPSLLQMVVADSRLIHGLARDVCDAIEHSRPDVAPRTGTSTPGSV